MEKLNKDREVDDTLALSTQGKRFAVIVDEAHSSQSGESAMELKGVLNKDGIAEAASTYATDNGLDIEDLNEADRDRMDRVVREMQKRGKQPNISFFAFTATLQYKTLKVFDEPDSNGVSPFHSYTMKQAIEEKYQTGFDQPLLHTMYFVSPSASD